MGELECIDGVLLFWMAHEVSDQAAMVQHLIVLLKPGAFLLLVEPKEYRGALRGDRVQGNRS